MDRRRGHLEGTLVFCRTFTGLTACGEEAKIGFGIQSMPSSSQNSKRSGWSQRPKQTVGL